MEQNNKVTTSQIWLGIFMVVLLIAGYWLADQVSFKKEESANTKIVQQVSTEVIKEVILKKPSCPDTSEGYEKLKNLNQVVSLATDLKSYGEKGQFVNLKKTVIKSSGSGSQLACGYLYIKAHAGKRPLRLEWEHPYVKPGQFGGHIVVGESILPTSGNDHTELLFNLSKIKYWTENSDKEIRKADWAALLNVSDRIEFEIGLNTSDKLGTLDEVSIAYECWSPETGQVTHDCKLEVEK